MTGYSETPLIKKLGIKEEMKILLMNAPKDYMKILEYNITKQLVNKISDADFAHVFVISKEELKKSFMKIISEAKNNFPEAVLSVAHFCSPFLYVDVTIQLKYQVKPLICRRQALPEIAYLVRKPGP